MLLSGIQPSSEIADGFLLAYQGFAFSGKLRVQHLDAHSQLCRLDLMGCHWGCRK